MEERDPSTLLPLDTTLTGLSAELFFPRKSVVLLSTLLKTALIPPLHTVVTFYALSLLCFLFFITSAHHYHLFYILLYIYLLTISPLKRKLPQKITLSLLLPAATWVPRSVSGTHFLDFLCAAIYSIISSKRWLSW